MGTDAIHYAGMGIGSVLYFRSFTKKEFNYWDIILFISGVTLLFI
jgi:hypothetical protein